MTFQQKSEEIHLITAAGKSAFICETKDRAILRWEQLGKPRDWTIQLVTTLKADITPAIMDPKLAPKSAMIHQIARERGIPVIDVKLAQVG